MRADMLVEEGFPEGLREVLYELAEREPPFDPSKDSLNLYRGTSLSGFRDNMHQDVYAQENQVFFTHRKEGEQGSATSYARIGSQPEDTPVVVKAEIPWDMIGGTVEDEYCELEELESGKVYLSEFLPSLDNSTWIGYGLNTEYFELEQL